MHRFLRRGLIERALLVIVGAAIASGIVAGGLTYFLPKTYEASATLLIGRATTGSGPDYQDLLAAQILGQTYAEVASTRPILSAVATNLGLDVTPQQLAGSMSVQASGIIPTVRISVRGGDQERVAAIANEVARQLVTWQPAVPSTDVQALPELTKTLASVDAQIAQVQSEADKLRAQGADAAPGALEASMSRLSSLLSTRTTLLQVIASTARTSVLVIEPADRPAEAAQSRTLVNAAAAALLGALVAAGGLFATSEIRRSSRHLAIEA